jgi:hypothetical protein
LVDWSESEGRAYLTHYQAEDILNWRVGRVGGRIIPTLIVLREFVEKPLSAEVIGQTQAVDEFDTARVEQIRVLKLGDALDEQGLPTGGLAYNVEIWQEIDIQEDDVTTKERKRKKAKQEKKWQLIETFVPSKTGDALTEIPFVFHGVENTSPDPDKSPIEDLARKNLDHYRISTQLRHGLFFSSSPTAVIADSEAKNEEGQQWRIGSQTAWLLSSEGDAKYLEFTGQGLTPLNETLSMIKDEMTVIGARLLEAQKKAAEAAETHEIRQSGESSVLADIANTVSEGLTRVMQWVFWWEGAAELITEIDESEASYNLNRS